MAIYRYFENNTRGTYGQNYTEDSSKAAIWLIQGRQVNRYSEVDMQWVPVVIKYEIVKEPNTHD